MFNIEAFKDFIQCLGNVTSDNDMKKKVEFINNMLDDETLEILKKLFIKKYSNCPDMNQGLSSLAAEIYRRRSQKINDNILHTVFNTNSIAKEDKMKDIKDSSGAGEIIGKINKKRGFFPISQASVDASKFVKDCLAKNS